MFRKLAIGLCAWYASCAAFAQTSLSGIVNHYAAVTAIDYCQNSATLSGTTGFGPGTTVLLMQMKGATINTANSAAFGDVTSLGSAGLFEKAIIASISGNTVVFQQALINHYDTGGNVQLVDVPVYESAIVTATLTAAPWNGQTGGVLALEVSGTLTLQADLDASGKGFRGGISNITVTNDCSWLVNVSNYAYALNDWRGAAKGEGVAAFVANQQAGRGAQANGGGGGNDHNSGGGGGANTSAGGQGGNNEEPSTFGCDGEFPGRGGKALSVTAGRCYFGGGGGAGHENNGLGTDGGNGGGILFVKAGQITANGFALRANGADAAGTFGEGAGGGGGGGTILLEATTLNGALLAEARGGKGGNIDNMGANRCFGPGGGGGGGRILFPGALSLTTNVSGGSAGLTSNSSACANGSNGAQAGNAGSTGALTGMPQGTEPNMPPQIFSPPLVLPACEGDLLTIPISVQGFELEYRWQVNTGSGFTDLQEGAIYSGTGSATLQIGGVTGGMDDYVFRLRVSSNCFPALFSPEVTLGVLADPQAAFSFAIAGNQVSFTNNSVAASGYWWDFGDGQSSSAANPQHLYADEGNYVVTLAAINPCDTAYATLTLALFTVPAAGFSAESTESCVQEAVSFHNESSGIYTSLLWAFPGGAPATSTQDNPVVTYAQAGVYDVTLIASGPGGSDTLSLMAFVSILPQPVADFSFQLAGDQVTFTNLSVHATAYDWDFGDSEHSSQANPQHVYADEGTYTVTLAAINACDTAYSAMTFDIFIAPEAGFAAENSEGCEPRTVSFQNESSGTYTSLLWSFPGGAPATSDQENPVVTYSQPGVYDVTLVVIGPTLRDTLTLAGVVSVFPQPVPAFSFEVTGNQVIFTNLSAEATVYNWDFGDDQISTLANPQHTYALPGAYSVTLNAQNAWCGNAISQTVVISTNATGEQEGTSAIRVFPNPAGGLLHVQSDDRYSPLECELQTMQGITLLKKVLLPDALLDLEALPAGTYYLKIRQGGVKQAVRVIKH